MRKLAEWVSWFLVFLLLGAGVGLVVLRPWNHQTANLVSGSTRPNITPSVATTPVTASAGSKCPDIVVRKTEQLTNVIPRGAWIEASDGVNVRAAPSFSAARLTTLPTGTALTLQEGQTNPDGTVWYRIRLDDGRNGW